MPEPPACEIDPVGPTEIAARLKVPINTIHAWNYDKVLPPPRWRVGPGPVWDWTDIEAWAIATGRLTTLAPSPVHLHPAVQAGHDLTSCFPLGGQRCAVRLRTRSAKSGSLAISAIRARKMADPGTNQSSAVRRRNA
jgi:hypothetical protein